MPALMFVGEVCGKAEEAIGCYTSVFKNARSEVLARYEKGEEPDREGTVKYAQFILDGQEFGAMDSAWMHDFGFNEAVSFIVNCKDQQEIDYFWEKLSAVPEAEQCGWVKDKFGVSWQIVPANMEELLAKNPAKTTLVMLQMKKIIIADLEKAGEER
jgi:predicted 3-demethylubiquinone-9 3-methyltransferase (glyoxalase superfamily)